MAENSTFTSILANTRFAAVNIPPQLDYVIETAANASLWTILLTTLAVLVAYDQGQYRAAQEQLENVILTELRHLS
jgi:C-22 sterol desaturase